jgi:hypothetical protein
MSAMTDRQKRAVDTYFTAFAKYRKILAMRLGGLRIGDKGEYAEAVEWAAYELAHEAAGVVTNAFGVKYDTPRAGGWRFLTFRKSPPRRAAVVSVMRELAATKRMDNAAFAKWLDHGRTPAAKASRAA